MDKELTLIEVVSCGHHSGIVQNIFSYKMHCLLRIFSSGRYHYFGCTF